MLEWISWIQDKWFEHKKEVLTWEGKVVEYKMEDWLEKNKDFLVDLYITEGGKDDGSI
jgi:myosin heavy subunit